jgi:hypothetical protein
MPADLQAIGNYLDLTVKLHRNLNSILKLNKKLKTCSENWPYL